MNKFAFLVFIFGIMFVSTAISVTDTLLEGQQDSYDINDNEYVVKVLSIEQVLDTNFVNFSIGVNITPILNIGGNYELNDVKITVHNITYVDDTSGLNSVNFSFEFIYNKCGNNLCEESETCSSCTQDCGCNEDYLCTSGQCVEQVRCGDNRCSSGETCILDQCCNGQTYHLRWDNNNCGSCGNVCSANQECVSGYCANSTGYCGDGICDLNEDCGICIEDCGCAGNETCVDNVCEVILEVPQEDNISTLNSTESVGAGYVDPDEISTDSSQTEETENLQSEIIESSKDKNIFSKLGLSLIFIIPLSIVLFLFYRRKHKIVDNKLQKPDKGNFQNMQTQQNTDDIKLKNYIKTCLDKGSDPEEVKKILLISDWTEEKINDAFNELK